MGVGGGVKERWKREVCGVCVWGAQGARGTCVTQAAVGHTWLRMYVCEKCAGGMCEAGV